MTIKIKDELGKNCKRCNQKKELIFCKDCYNKVKDLYFEYKNKNYIKWWIMIGFLVTVFFIFSLIWYQNVNIDEVEFCGNKLKANFPEYDFTRFADSSEGNDKTCVGYYKIKSNIIRDGLEEINEMEEDHKSYKLLEKEDADYLTKDDFAGWVFLISIISLGIYFYALFKDWSGI